MKAPCDAVGVGGTLAGFPLVAVVSSEGGAPCFEGVLHVKGGALHDLVRLDQHEPLDPFLAAALDELVGASDALAVTLSRGLLTCSLSTGRITSRLVRRGRDLGFAIMLGKGSDVSPASKLAPLMKGVHGVHGVLGALDRTELLLAYRRGALSIHEMRAFSAVRLSTAASPRSTAPSRRRRRPSR